jgi:hypothetical protein
LDGKSLEPLDTLGNLEKGTGTVSLEKAFHIMRMLGIELHIEPWG